MDELNVQYMYDQVIRQLIANDQFGNSQIYQSAANLLKDKRGAGLTLDVIDKDFLTNLELDGSESAKDERKTVNDWTKRVNKELKAIGEALGIGVTLTTYTARHTAVTVLVRSGVPLSDIKDMLGHSSIKTTESYVASLDIDTRINNAKKLERKLVIKKKARPK